MAGDSAVHKDHRRRMKETFLEHGIDVFNEHQVLEMLLFFSKPQGDTNPTGHELINRFGSLRNVLEAEYGELSGVKGVGEHTAVMIKFFQALARRYLTEASVGEAEKFTDTERLRCFFESLFLGVKTEEVYALALDDELRFIKYAKIMDGFADKVRISARAVTDFAIKNDCGRIVLAHNHPGGVGMPSRSDIQVTAGIYYLLRELDITLLDHIIVGKTGSCSMRAMSCGDEIWGKPAEEF